MFRIYVPGAAEGEVQHVRVGQAQRGAVRGAPVEAVAADQVRQRAEGAQLQDQAYAADIQEHRGEEKQLSWKKGTVQTIHHQSYTPER